MLSVIDAFVTKTRLKSSPTASAEVLLPIVEISADWSAARQAGPPPARRIHVLGKPSDNAVSVLDRHIRERGVGTGKRPRRLEANGRRLRGEHILDPVAEQQRRDKIMHVPTNIPVETQLVMDALDVRDEQANVIAMIEGALLRHQVRQLNVR